MTSVLHQIKQCVIDQDYLFSFHAEVEMANDELEYEDIEHAILHGRIQKKLTADVRGTRYRVEGPAQDGRLIHVICRFLEVNSMLIITVYALE